MEGKGGNKAGDIDKAKSCKNLNCMFLENG